jgi:hypothetical protein
MRAFRDTEVISILDDSPKLSPRSIELISVKFNRAATHIPFIPGLIIGNTEIKR